MNTNNVGQIDQNASMVMAAAPITKWNGYQIGLALTLGVALTVTTTAVVASAIFGGMLTIAATAAIAVGIGAVTVLIAGKYLGIGPFRTLPEVGVFFDKYKGVPLLKISSYVDEGVLYLFEELKKQISDVTFVEASSEPTKKFKVSLFITPTNGQRFGPTMVFNKEIYDQSINKQRTLKTIAIAAMQYKIVQGFNIKPPTDFEGHITFGVLGKKLIQEGSTTNQERMVELRTKIHTILEADDV